MRALLEEPDWGGEPGTRSSFINRQPGKERAMKHAALLAVAFSTLVLGSQGAPKALLLVRDQGSQQLEYMLVNEVGPMTRILRDAGFEVRIASVSGKTIKTDSIVVTPDYRLEDVRIDDYAGFMLPCITNDWAPPELVTFVRELVKRGKPIAAQMGGIHVLGHAGALNKRRFAFAEEEDDDVSMYPALKGGIYAGRGVVKDGVIVTSGTCPWMAKLHGHQDGTTELTQTLIDVMRTRTK